MAWRLSFSPSNDCNLEWFYLTHKTFNNNSWKIATNKQKNTIERLNLIYYFIILNLSACIISEKGIAQQMFSFLKFYFLLPSFTLTFSEFCFSCNRWHWGCEGYRSKRKMELSRRKTEMEKKIMKPCLILIFLDFNKTILIFKEIRLI